MVLILSSKWTVSKSASVAELYIFPQKLVEESWGVAGCRIGAVAGV